MHAPLSTIRPDINSLSPKREKRLLTAAEEQLLTSLVVAGRFAASQLTKERDPAQRALLLVAEARGKTARDELIIGFLGLVYSLVDRLGHTGSLTREDLASYGVFGLIEAISRYDAMRGYRFSTYATWWVRKAVGRAISDYSRTVRLPTHIQDKLQRASHADGLLTEAEEHEPNTEVHTPPLDSARAELNRIRRMTRHTTSLDQAISADEEMSIGDTIADEQAGAAYAQVEDRLAIAEALTALKDSEREVVILLYGLDGEQLSLTDVGMRLNLAPTRVRQLHGSALVKLRLAIVGNQPADVSERLAFLTIQGKNFVSSNSTAMAQWLEMQGFVWCEDKAEWWRAEGREGINISKTGQVLCLGADHLKVQELLTRYARR